MLLLLDEIRAHARTVDSIHLLSYYQFIDVDREALGQTRSFWTLLNRSRNMVLASK